ncbi:hypothetical protein BV898_12393 [Hypsibius exemplaris]|uniref:Receptor ligand binding region domain-containing protein n=1 Tax=Hypsibius exemplaris TaxID=2072580 RepID=A0A1W0WDT9_HYPEX|nr:hypothetical protein BV898_12393 [Hypsibius exemplaris]
MRVFFTHGAQVVSQPINVEIASIGHIYPDNSVCLPYVGPAQDIALEAINEQYDHLFNFSITYIFDRKLKSCVDVADNAADLVSRWYYKKRSANSIPALVFPSCTDTETYAVNQLAASHNLLMITGVATHYVLMNKTQSPTFLTVGHSSSSSYLQFYRAVIPLFNWRSVFILAVQYTGAGLSYVNIARTAVRAISSLPHQMLTVKFISEVFTATRLQQVLEQFRSISRVMLCFGRAEVVRALLIAKRAFQSLLVVRPVDFNDTLTEVRGFTTAELSRRARSEYNFSLTLTGQPLVNLISPFLAINLLGQPFLLMHVKSNLIVNLSSVTWVDNRPWPPSNEPQCGYTGRSGRCEAANSGPASSIALIVICAALGPACVIVALLRCYGYFGNTLTDQTWWLMENHIIPRASHFQGQNIIW